MIFVLLNVLGAQFLSIDSATIPINKEDVPIQSDNISQLNTYPKVGNDTNDSEYDLMRIGKFVPQVWEYDDLKLDIWVFTVNNNASNNHLAKDYQPSFPSYNISSGFENEIGIPILHQSNLHSNSSIQGRIKLTKSYKLSAQNSDPMALSSSRLR